MLTIKLEPELEKQLKILAKQEQISIDEVATRLLSFSLKKQQDSELLIDIVKTLPEISCFKNKPPLEIQESLRDEWH